MAIAVCLQNDRTGGAGRPTTGCFTSLPPRPRRMRKKALPPPRRPESPESPDPTPLSLGMVSGVGTRKTNSNYGGSGKRRAAEGRAAKQRALLHAQDAAAARKKDIRRSVAVAVGDRLQLWPKNKKRRRRRRKKKPPISLATENSERRGGGGRKGERGGPLSRRWRWRTRRRRRRRSELMNDRRVFAVFGPPLIGSALQRRREEGRREGGKKVARIISHCHSRVPYGKTRCRSSTRIRDIRQDP